MVINLVETYYVSRLREGVVFVVFRLITRKQDFENRLSKVRVLKLRAVVSHHFIEHDEIPICELLSDKCLAIVFEEAIAKARGGYPFAEISPRHTVLLLKFWTAQRLLRMIQIDYSSANVVR